MNWILKMVADMLLKGMGPINGWKTIVGLTIAILSYIATAAGIEIPVIGAEMAGLIGYILAAFGLGHKGGKAV